MPGGKPADDGVAGPAQRGDAEQQIGLVGDPVAGRGGARWSEADIRARFLARFMTPRPAWRARRAGMLPGRLTDTDFLRASMGRMHRDHAARSMAAGPALRGAKGSAGVSGVGCALAFHHLLGELNQQTLGLKVLQFAERPQQPQFEQRLQRLDALPATMVRPSRLAPARAGTDRAAIRARRRFPSGGAASRPFDRRRLPRRPDRRTEHLGEIALRQADREPLRLHQPVDLPVGRGRSSLGSVGCAREKSVRPSVAIPS